VRHEMKKDSTSSARDERRASFYFALSATRERSTCPLCRQRAAWQLLSILMQTTKFISSDFNDSPAPFGWGFLHRPGNQKVQALRPGQSSPTAKKKPQRSWKEAGAKSTAGRFTGGIIHGGPMVGSARLPQPYREMTVHRLPPPLRYGHDAHEQDNDARCAIEVRETKSVVRRHYPRVVTQRLPAEVVCAYAGLRVDQAGQK
jgi:hypothetical protein